MVAQRSNLAISLRVTVSDRETHVYAESRSDLDNYLVAIDLSQS